MFKSNEVYLLIRDLVNEGAKLTFEEDFGGDTMTITIEHHKKIFKWGDGKGGTTQETHTHVHTGFPDCGPEKGEQAFVRALQEFRDMVKTELASQQKT